MPFVLRRVASIVNSIPPALVARPMPVQRQQEQPTFQAYRRAPVPVASRIITKLPAGDAGTAKTVGWMRRLIVQGSKSLPIRETAANLAMRYATDQGKIRAIFDFVKNKMKYVRDPLHQEMLAGADYHYTTMGAEGYARGDCDDHTIMLGAMLESIGYPTRITTARMRPGNGAFDHVFIEVNDRTGWIPLDASNKKREAGEPPPANRLRRW